MNNQQKEEGSLGETLPVNGTLASAQGPHRSYSAMLNYQAQLPANYVRVSAEFLLKAGLSRAEKLVLISILAKAGTRLDVVIPLSELITMTDYSERQVRNIIKFLKQKGYIAGTTRASSPDGGTMLWFHLGIDTKTVAELEVFEEEISKVDAIAASLHPVETVTHAGKDTLEVNKKALWEKLLVVFPQEKLTGKMLAQKTFMRMALSRQAECLEKAKEYAKYFRTAPLQDHQYWWGFDSWLAGHWEDPVVAWEKKARGNSNLPSGCTPQDVSKSLNKVIKL